jgi:hypothetical protein
LIPLNTSLTLDHDFHFHDVFLLGLHEHMDVLCIGSLKPST